MLNFASFVVVLVSLAVVTNGFLQVPSNRNSKFLSMQINSKPEKSIIIELIARKEITGKRLQSGREVGQKKQSGLKSRASAGLYKEKGDTIMEKLVDSPVSTLASFLLNPTTLVLVVYLSSVAWGQVSWVQQIFKLFGRGTLVKRPGSPIPEDQLPFQTFECEECGMEMRPARGRAKAIFGNKRFCCPKCGAKASSFFDIDDVDDPRAVERLERLERMKNEDEEAGIEPEMDDDPTE